MRLGAGIWAVTLAGARRRNAPICNRSFTNPSHAHVNPTGGCVGPFMRTLTRQVVAWGSSPTARPSSAWSEPSSPNKTTNGPKSDATSASTSSPDHDSHHNLMCPGYCGECLRPDWRFGMSGQRKYSMELRERATRMALEARADPGRRRGAIKRIGGQLGINPEALRTWVRAVEQGGRNERGEVSDQEARIRALEAENRELRRANEILKAASAFFGAELDRLGR